MNNIENYKKCLAKNIETYNQLKDSIDKLTIEEQARLLKAKWFDSFANLLLNK